MNEHEMVRAMLALAAADALDPQETLRVHTHVGECEQCRRELAAWAGYAEGLRDLPQPAIPADLVRRTQARMPERHGHWALGALAVFGWASTGSMWMVARVLAGGAVRVFGINLLDGFTWLLVTTVVGGIGGATAAVMLRSRRTYESLA